MVRSGRERLTGRIEVDEAYVGGQQEGTRGRGAEGKTLVLVAVEGDAKAKLGRVRFRCVAAIDRSTVESLRMWWSQAQRLSLTDCLFITGLEPKDTNICLMLLLPGAMRHANNLNMFIWSFPCLNAGWEPLIRAR